MIGKRQRLAWIFLVPPVPFRRVSTGTMRLLLLALAAQAAASPADPPPAGRRPNVVLVISDDQGYGDLGFHGNRRIRTPILDALAGRSARLSRFYVSPVCSPTRASLMTGRYNYR